MEHRDQLNPSWTTDIRTTWIWDILYRCQQPVT